MFTLTTLKQVSIVNFTRIGLPGIAVPIALKKNFQSALALTSCSIQSSPASNIDTPDQYILNVGFATMIVVSGKLYR